MNHLKLGTCKFILFATADPAHPRVDIEAEISDPNIPSLDILVSRAWLLMLESQIGKVTKQVQDLVLDTLSGLTLVYFKYGVVPPRTEKTENMCHLATLEIQLCFGNKLFVLAYPHDFNPNLRADGLAGTIMVNSLSTICEILQGEARDTILYMLIFGLHKWETSGRPGIMTAFTQTWNFEEIDKTIARGKQLVNHMII